MMISWSNKHSLNERDPINATDSGMLILISEEHSKNALHSNAFFMIEY